MCSEVHLCSQSDLVRRESPPLIPSLNSMGRLSIVYDEGCALPSFHAAYQNQAQLPDRKRPQPEPLPTVPLNSFRVCRQRKRIRALYTLGSTKSSPASADGVLLLYYHFICGLYIGIVYICHIMCRIRS